MQTFKNSLLLFFCIAGLLFSGSGCCRYSRPERRSGLTLPGNAILLDVRSTAEFQSGHLPGAVNLPHDLIAQSTMEKIAPQRSTPIYLYCRSGRRSAMAGEKLRLLQYNKLTDLGGMEQAQQQLRMSVVK